MEKTTRFRWYDPLLLRVLPPAAAVMIKLLMRSCRIVRIEGLDRCREAVSRTGGGAVYASWHQRMSFHFHYFGARRVIMIISRSRDGEYGARLAAWMGFQDVRGSSSRGGMTALRKMVERVRNGGTGGVLADGPQGPAREAKIGSILIARDSGTPVIPVLWGADRCWVLNSWDRYLIPKPFARVAVYYGEPIWIPRSARGKNLEPYRSLLEQRLNAGTRWCDEQFGPERPWRKPGNGVPETGPIRL